MNKIKGYETDVMFCIILVVILAARFIIPEEKFPEYFISLINFIGLSLAALSTFKQIIKVLRKNKLKNFLAIIWWILFISAIIFGVYCLIWKINFSSKNNDYITILALACSIPNEWYMHIIKEHQK